MLVITLLISLTIAFILFSKLQRLYVYKTTVRKSFSEGAIDTSDNLLCDDTPDMMQADEHTTTVPQVSLYCQLHKLIESKKLYLDTELDVETVVKTLRTNKKYLYYAITENSDDNFRNIVNRYRIEEAKKNIELKIQNNESVNISELYLSSGFSSSVTFYRSFKLITGFTPKEYAIHLNDKEISYAMN